MARAITVEFYRAYRFMAVLQTEKGLKSWPLGRVDQDPFSGDVFLWRGIVANEPLMADEIKAPGELVVFLLDREAKTGKQINFKYQGVRKIPLHLDAAKNEIAVERLALTDVEYGRSQDVDYDDLPPEMRSDVIEDDEGEGHD